MCRRISHLFTKSWEQNEHVYLLDSLFTVAFLVFTLGADFFLKYNVIIKETNQIVSKPNATPAVSESETTPTVSTGVDNDDNQGKERIATSSPPITVITVAQPAFISSKK